MRILGMYVLGIALTVGVPMLAAPRAQAGEVSTQAEDRSKETVVKGVVVDEGGQFVQDAVVTVKGSSKKAKTNAKGEFKIKAKNSSAPVKLRSIVDSEEFGRIADSVMNVTVMP